MMIMALSKLVRSLSLGLRRKQSLQPFFSSPVSLYPFVLSPALGVSPFGPVFMESTSLYCYSFIFLKFMSVHPYRSILFVSFRVSLSIRTSFINVTFSNALVKSLSELLL